MEVTLKLLENFAGLALAGNSSLVFSISSLVTGSVGNVRKSATKDGNGLSGGTLSSGIYFHDVRRLAISGRYP